MAAKTKPHILFLPRWYPNRLDPQLGVFVRKHAEALAGKVNIAVIYPHADPERKSGSLDHHNLNNVDTYLAYYPHRKGHWFAPLQNAFAYIQAFRKAWKAYRQRNPYPDLFHVHVLLRPLLMAVLLSLKTRKPIVLTEHWTGYVFGFFRKKSLLYRRLAGILLRRVSTITVVSPSLEKAMKASGLEHPDYRVIGNVVEVRIRDRDRDRDRDRNKDKEGGNKDGQVDKRIILTVADMVDRNKNISGALKAIEAVARERIDFEYHIIGGGPDEEMLRMKAQQSGLMKGVIFFHGRKDNEYVLGTLARSDFLLVNSNVETFSVVTAEALAAGKPVIATRSGGPEYFVTEDCGILIDPGDDDALKKAIRYMLDHSSEYNPERMHAVVKERFSSDSIGKQFLGIYSELLS